MTHKRYAFSLEDVECGKGWKDLYEPLLNMCNNLGIEIYQVKEKFGGLRFYVGGIPEKDQWVETIIQWFEHLSYEVCEECGAIDGAPKDGCKTIVTTKGGWLKTLCEKCRGKADELKNKEADEASQG